MQNVRKCGSERKIYIGIENVDGAAKFPNSSGSVVLEMRILEGRVHVNVHMHVSDPYVYALRHRNINFKWEFTY